MESVCIPKHARPSRGIRQRIRTVANFLISHFLLDCRQFCSRQSLKDPVSSVDLYKPPSIVRLT